ncbi:RICIN domain-containing protein [Silvibacterium acidisoli]|uniref:RICIN domain-containing protein n=1 Tax=Acidobacteriaceae bacterium ZG23-2 TaxID=2883246 RepID=UPI00406C5C90
MPARLSFTPIPTHAFGDAPIHISATSNSNGAITYKLLGGPATLSGDTLTLTGGGRVRLLASQAAAGVHNAATTQTSFAVTTATSRSMKFTQVGAAVSSKIQSDTPNFLFIDSNGQFFLQNADSDYDQKPENHVWNFYTGRNVHDPDLKLSKEHSQFDTQKLCTVGSPVYRKLYSVPGVKPGARAFTDGNFCDAVGVWVDPDTGDWYAVVHNELYPSIPRIDVISYAISKDHGKTWELKEPIATSPYGAANTKDFYYDYGEGDARLVVDTGSGYFYLFYNSRITKTAGYGTGKGFSAHEWEHVSRAPIYKKMAPDSWEKYYNGGWSQTPGIDWACDPSHSSCPEGGPASALGSNIGADNDPSIQERFVQPVARQKASDLAGYTNSNLHTASISWNVALGKYIAFAEDRDLSLKSSDYDNPTEEMSFYVTDDLNTQKWTYAGSIAYKSASWYRWLVDPGNLTSSNTIGSSFLAYCSVDCSDPKNDSEYVKIAVSMSSNAARPVWFSDLHGATSPGMAYRIGHAASSSGDTWNIVPVPADPGFFTLQHEGKYLGTAAGDAGRSWGAAVSLGEPFTVLSGVERSRQQWYFEKIRDLHGRTVTSNQYRIVNRYSGLALSFSGSSLNANDLAAAVTVPIRDWDAAATGTHFKVWKAAEQELSLTAR